MSLTPTRREHDLLGERDVPASAYYGVHTLRAVENFPITGTTIAIYPELLHALAAIKRAAAEANHALGLLDKTRMDAIVSACEEIRAGALADQFVVDVIQGGAGTSTNMNANEVIANRALEILGHQRGEYEFLHPNEHVNMSQSTNDVYPTALKLATQTVPINAVTKFLSKDISGEGNPPIASNTPVDSPGQLQFDDGTMRAV